MTHARPERPAARRARLCLVSLESREGPSSLTGLPGADLLTQLPSPSPVPGSDRLPPAPAPGQQNRPPVISNFRAIVGPGGRVTFTGTVSDDQPVAGLVVAISGGGVTATAIVGDDGTFRVTTTVPGTQPVTVIATTTDGQGAASDPVQTTFTPTP